MTAPERIWAWDDVLINSRDKSWSRTCAGVGSLEYVRADLYEALKAEISYDLERANSRLISENDDLRKAIKEVIKAKSESGCKMIARRSLGLAPRINRKEVMPCDSGCPA